MSVESKRAGRSEFRIGEKVFEVAELTLILLSRNEADAQIPRVLVSAYDDLQNGLILRTRPSEREAWRTDRFPTLVLSSVGSAVLVYTIRRLPEHTDTISPSLPGLIKSAQAASPVAELPAR